MPWWRHMRSRLLTMAIAKKRASPNEPDRLFAKNGLFRTTWCSVRSKHDREQSARQRSDVQILDVYDRNERPEDAPTSIGRLLTARTSQELPANAGRPRWIAFRITREMMKDTLEPYSSPMLRTTVALTHVLRRHFSGLGIIVTLHEVHQEPESELMTGCAVDLLEKLVRWLRYMGWNIVSIDDALRLNAKSADKPFAVLTFDDGYRDTLDRALPVLDRLGAPFTVYVQTHAITRDLYAWWPGLRHLFQSHDVVFVSAMERTFQCSVRATKIAGLKACCNWVDQDFTRAEELRETFATYGITIEALVDRYFLDKNSVRSMARHPLVTIGAHSTSHVALTTIDDDAVRHEMADSRVFLEQLLEEEIVHFAYPYGGATTESSR